MPKIVTTITFLTKEFLMPAMAGMIQAAGGDSIEKDLTLSIA